MAIWIDENGHKPDCDQQMLFEYLYHLCYILSYKWKYFNTQKDYDEFAIFSAGILFKRYVQQSQLQPVKSSLNYIKKVLRIYKIQFQKEFFQENITRDIQDENVKYNISFEYELQDKCSQLNKVEFLVYLQDIPRTILGSLTNSIPKKKHSSEFTNIYLSCLLTFLDLITPSVQEQKQLDSIQRSDYIYTNLYLQLYKIPDGYKPVLYHLDKTYEDYILLLVKRIRASIRNDLKELLYQHFPINDLYQDILEQFQESNDN